MIIALVIQAILGGALFYVVAQSLRTGAVTSRQGREGPHIVRRSEDPRRYWSNLAPLIIFLFVVVGGFVFTALSMPQR